MVWATGLLTLLATVTGATFTLLAERVRWRRQQGEQARTVRRESYVRYLSALHDGSEGIRAVALGQDTGSNRRAAADSAFRTAEIYAAREAVDLLASRALAEAAGEAFHRVRRLRDLAAKDDVDVASPEYQDELDAYRESLTLRRSMRSDLADA